MKRFKLSYKNILLVLVIIVGSLLAWLLLLMPMIYNPMRRPAPLIRLHILRHTPIGTRIEEAIEVIENNERWGTPGINRTSGFSHPSLFVPEGPGGSPTAAIVGDQSIQTWPDRYNTLLIFERHLRISWGFDENGKLIDIYVRSGFIRRLAS